MTGWQPYSSKVTLFSNGANLILFLPNSIIGNHSANGDFSSVTKEWLKEEGSYFNLTLNMHFSECGRYRSRTVPSGSTS